MTSAIRSTLFYLGMALVTLAMMPLLPLLVPLPYQQRFRVLRLWSRFNIWWLGIACGLRFRVEGLEHLPRGPAVVLAKHQSAWETMALQLLLPAQTWVLKRELLWIPLFGWGLAMTRPIAINRGSAKQALRQVISQGADRLSGGIWVVVFPEGTRTEPGERRKYANGGAMLALKGGVPVLPVAHNAGVFWPRRGFRKYPGTIELAFGPVIDTQGRSAGEVTAAAEAWIEARVAAMPSDRDGSVALVESSSR